MHKSISIACAFMVIATMSTFVAARHSFRMRHKLATFNRGKSIPAGQYTSTSARHTIPMNGGTVSSGAFFVDMFVGTGAGQVMFSPQVDTGSSNTEFPSVGCATCGSSSTAQFYNSSASPTAKPLGCEDPFCLNCDPLPVPSGPSSEKTIAAAAKKNVAKRALAASMPFGAQSAESKCPFGPAVCTQGTCGWQVTYGGNSLATSGNIVRDQVCYITETSKLVCGEVFVDQILNEYPTGCLPTGILGLAFPRNGCNPTCQPTIMDSFVAQGVLKENKFGMCLTKSTGGVLDLGYSNSTRYHGSLMYTPIVKKHWYNIDVRDFLVDGVSIGIPSFMYAITNDVIGSFVDSGTTPVLVGPQTFAALAQMMVSKYASLPHVTTFFSAANGAFQGGCANITNSSVIGMYPKMSFEVSGMPGQPTFDVSMDGSDYLVNMPPGSPQYCLMIAGTPSIGAILGDIIMQNYYIEFDRYSGKLGFAKVKNCM